MTTEVSKTTQAPQASVEIVDFVSVTDVRNRAKNKSNATLLRDSDIRAMIAEVTPLEIRETPKASATTVRAYTLMRHAPSLPIVAYVYTSNVDAVTRRTAALIAASAHISKDNATFAKNVNTFLTAASKANLLDAAQAKSAAKKILESTPFISK